MKVIEELKRLISIKDLVVKAGLEVDSSGFATSIYKNETTPSMKINYEDNYFYCFATNQGGDIIKFYEDFYKVDTSTAVKGLAAIAGISNTDYQAPDRNKNSFQQEIGKLNAEREVLFTSVTPKEKALYKETLNKSGYADENEAHRAAITAVRKARLHINRTIFNDIYAHSLKYVNYPAINYLLDRGLPMEAIYKFKIMTIKNYAKINDELRQKYSVHDLIRAGLYNNKDGRSNLRFFNHRILIPYLHNDNIVYLRGRYFDKDNNANTDRYKYLGLTDDRVGVNRSKRFFNSDIVKSMQPNNKLYITEGELDTMILSSKGLNSIAIAGAGNIPAEKYFIPLLQFNITICADADEAGRRLTENLYKLLKGLRYKREILIKELPTKDVNDFFIMANNDKKQN